MKSLLSFVVVLVALCWGALCVNSALPTTVSVDNIATDPNVSTAALVALRVALNTGLVKTEIHDHVVFRTATVTIGDEHIQLAALPGTKWYRYE